MEVDLQALCDESPFHRSLEARITATSDGVALTALTGDQFAVDGSRRAVHGGIIASLLDMAATFALVARTGHDWVTVDLRVDYLRPTPVGPVSVNGEVIRAGRSIGRARGSLLDANGVLCAVAIGTFAPNPP